MSLVNKIAVVTGAHGGIGSVLVEKLKSEGVKCACIDRHREFDGDYECDLASADQVEQVAGEIISNFGEVDFLINMAGVGIYKEIKDLDPDEWQLSLDINLTAPYLLIKYLLPALKKSKKALVFNVGSKMGILPWEGRTAYCSSKFGLRGLSLSLSKELAKEGVDVSLLTLGSVMTNFGTGGIAKRKALQEKGKKYLRPEQVADKMIKIIKSDYRKEEYILNP